MYQSYFNRPEVVFPVVPVVPVAPQQSDSAAIPELAISLFKNVRDNDPKQYCLNWSDLCKKYFLKHQILKIKENGPVWSPACFPARATRLKENVEAVSCAVFDIEHHGPFETLKDKLDGYAYLAHSSFRHTSDDPRYRIILPLLNPVSGRSWEVVWERLNQWIGGINDPQTSDASRIYFLPSMPADSTDHFIEVGEGRPLDIDELPELSLEVIAKASATSRKRHSKVKIEGIEDAPPDPLSPAVGLSRVVERCAFMQWASAKENQNNVSYPLWWAMISNASRFEESDEWIHESSCHYQAYDENKTELLIERCRAFGLPITCSKIQTDGFTGCPNGGCRKYSGETTKAPAGIWLNASSKAVSLVEEIVSTDDSDEDEKYFGCFVLTKDGVFKVSFKDGEEIRTKISSFIEITAQTRDSSQINWGFLINVIDPDGNQHQWSMPKEMLPSPNTWKAELLKMGANIYQTGKQDLLHEYFNESMPTARALCVMQPGWYEGVFVLPGRVIGNTTTEQVVLQTTDVSGAEIFRSNGTLSDWQNNVGALCAGNSRLVLVICAALTGPTLHLLGHENGGFHLFGATSTGKTTAVEVAASVWGKRSKFVRNWRTTGNAVEGVATRHNDTLLILDEISQVNPFEAGEIAYMLGNGQGKSRANIHGGARSISRWRLFYLSTGEQTLAEHMQGANKRIMAGQEVRLVNLPAVANSGMGLFENIHGSDSPQKFATLLKKTTDEFYGLAGPAFVEALADPERQTELLETIRKTAQDFAETYVPANSSSQVQRVGQRFALVAAVGEVAAQLGILPWPEGEAIAAARTCFQAWIEERGGIGSQEVDQAISQVRRFLEIHGESRFTAWDWRSDNNADGKTINRAGFRKATDDDRTEFYILPEVFRTEVCGGLNPKEVAKALRDAGYLLLASDGSNQRQERLPGIGSKKVYRIKPEILGDVV